MAETEAPLVIRAEAAEELQVREEAAVMEKIPITETRGVTEEAEEEPEVMAAEA